MAEPTTITQTLPAPVLEGALTAFTKKLEPLIGTPISTAAYAPQIAAESQLQQQARTAAGGLESLLGPQAYQQFMSPYQQEVIDTTLAEMDRQAAIQRQGIGQSAIQAGAFGGGREGVQRAEYDVNALAKRAATQAGLLQQGFQQAQQQALLQLQAQQGLGAYQQQIGQANQGYQQAILDANQVAAREEQYSPFTQIGLIGQQLSQMTPGTYPITTTTSTPPASAPVSPLSQFIGGAGMIGGTLGKLLG